MRIVAPPGVYRPRFDTRLLIHALREHPLPTRSRVLELCTGSGAVSLELARQGHDVTAVDLGRRAVWAARINAKINGRRLRVRRSDLFGAVAGEQFDAIVANPPYVPAPPEERAEGAARAWNAGLDGRMILDRIGAEIVGHLRPGGVVYIVQSSLADEQETIAQLERAGLQVDVAARSTGPLGPIAEARAGFLAAQGLDATQEDIVVVRGRLAGRPAPADDGSRARTPARERQESNLDLESSQAPSAA